MGSFLDTADISLDQAEITNYLGMPKETLTPDLIVIITQAISDMKSILRPRYVYRVFNKGESPEGIVLEGTNVVLRGNNIKKHLEGAEKIVVFACTLGTEAERFMRETAVTDLTKTVVLDAIATEFIEKLCDRIESIIMAEYISLSYSSNFSFSPGYGDLPLESQPDILNILEAQKKIALYCNENHIMIPRKSVTAIFGLFKGERAEEPPSPCSICQLYGSCTKKEGEENCGY